MSTRTDPLFPYTTLFRSRHRHSACISESFREAAGSGSRVAGGVTREQTPACRAADQCSVLFWNNPDQGMVRSRRLELPRSEEHTSELQSLMRISYAGFRLKKKNRQII